MGWTTIRYDSPLCNLSEVMVRIYILHFSVFPSAIITHTPTLLYSTRDTIKKRKKSIKSGYTINRAMSRVNHRLKYTLTNSPEETSRRISSIAFFALSKSRHAIITRAFLRANSRTVSFPIPELAPVTINTFPFKDDLLLQCPHWYSRNLRSNPSASRKGRNTYITCETILIYHGIYIRFAFQLRKKILLILTCCCTTSQPQILTVILTGHTPVVVYNLSPLVYLWCMHDT